MNTLKYSKEAEQALFCKNMILDLLPQIKFRQQIISSRKSNSISSLSMNSAEYEARSSKGMLPEANLRSIASQVIATLATNLVKFTFGTLGGFSTILLAELHQPNAEIQTTAKELALFSSHCFMIPVGSVLLGLLIQYVGSRLSLLLAALTYLTSSIIFYHATTSTTLLAAQALAGFTAPLCFTAGASYIVEITQPQFRSAFTASGILFILLGNLLTTALGSFLYWRTLTVVSISLATISFVAVYFIPNTPQWYSSKGNIVAAEKSLAWLRGWVKPDDIKQELSSLQETTQNKLDTINGNYLKRKLKLYMDRSFYLPLASVFYLLSVQSLAGTLTFMTYSIIIFDMMNSPIEKHVAATVFVMMRVISATTCVFVIRFIPIRKLLLSSLTITGISFLTASLFLYLIQQKSLLQIYSWVPSILVLIATFSSSGGSDKALFILIVELFPTKYRGLGSGIGYCWFSIVIAIMNNYFLYLVDSLSLHGVFLFFGLVNIVGVITFYFIIPETRNKTLRDIQEFYSKKTNTK